MMLTITPDALFRRDWHWREEFLGSHRDAVSPPSPPAAFLGSRWLPAEATVSAGDGFILEPSPSPLPYFFRRCD